MNLRGRVGLSAIAVTAAGVGVAIATGAIPGAGGTVSGCYAKSDGTLRVIDADLGKTCTSKEVALAWNRQGVAGPPGATGQTGATGPQGATGAQGPAGQDALSRKVIAGYVVADGTIG